MSKLRHQQRAFFLFVKLMLTPHLPIRRTIAAQLLYHSRSTLNTSSVIFRAFCSCKSWPLTFRGILKFIFTSESLNSITRELLGEKQRLPRIYSQRASAPVGVSTHSLNSTWMPYLIVVCGTWWGSAQGHTKEDSVCCQSQARNLCRVPVAELGQIAANAHFFSIVGLTCNWELNYESSHVLWM